MKTIAFHSVKGGVGRTLALNNFAQLLVKQKKKVLLLDFDYTAPGLHHKYNIHACSGYINYLKEESLENRINAKYQTRCEKSLKEKIIKIKENLYLLTSGKDSDAEYWTFISSFAFHKLFYFATKEISKLSYLSFANRQLIRNKKAFNNDKKYLKNTYDFDYLLIDCKTGIDTSAVALLFWSDIVVHFYPENNEGRKHLEFTENSIMHYNNKKDENDKKTHFIKVVTRVPSADYDEIKKDNPELNVFPELSCIEKGDNILFDDKDRNPKNSYFNQWNLSHDYIKLFAEILGEKSTDTLMKLMNMEKDKVIKNHNFDYHRNSGTMINIDGHPNISLRVDTFQAILCSFSEQSSNPHYNTQLKETGELAAQDFIKSFLKKYKAPVISGGLEEIIKQWAKFDSEVGFGTIQLEDFDPSQFSGSISVIGDVFQPKKSGCKLDYIFSGYMETVLTNIYKLSDANDPNVNISVQYAASQKLYKFKQENKETRKV